MLPCFDSILSVEKKKAVLEPFSDKKRYWCPFNNCLTFCSRLLRRVKPAHSVGNYRSANISRNGDKQILERLEMQLSMSNSTDANLQLFSWNVRISNGFGKSFLVSSQHAGKEIAVSTFQSRERQFIGSIVVVDSARLV